MNGPLALPTHPMLCKWTALKCLTSVVVDDDWWHGNRYCVSVCCKDFFLESSAYIYEDDNAGILILYQINTVFRKENRQ